MTWRALLIESTRGLPTSCFKKDKHFSLKINKVLSTMTTRSGKHFRGDKNVMIHDKTGRVIYMFCFARFVNVTSHVPFMYKELKQSPQYFAIPKAWFSRAHTDCIFLFADSDFMESLCKIAEGSV